MTPENFWQEAEDWHTAGEPFRIVRNLPAGSLSQGCTVAEQRLQIMRTPDHPLDILRQSLCHEPRGHADMYGGFIVPPDDKDAHFGVLFWHKDGFSTACGHGTIALGFWALANDVVDPIHDGEIDVVIDVPSGRVIARARCVRGEVQDVNFINVTSQQLSKDVAVSVTLGFRDISLLMDLAFGGAVYACVDVAALDIKVEPKNHQVFIDLQRQIKAQLLHYRYLDKYDLYGVCFFEELDESDEYVTQRNVVVFADGQIDRSPCGSGTAARVAVLLAQGRLVDGKRLKHLSILNTLFEATATNSERGTVPFPTCTPVVRGDARLVSRHNFYIDLTDPLFPGFVFR